MNQNDKSWLENRVHAAVDDDFYLDREEEKRIKEEAATKNIAARDTELVIRSELDKLGAVCERLLIDDLDSLLHQFTDNDKRLDGKEERNALDKVLAAAPGKKKGLDPRVAEEYTNSFCKVNGVRRDTETKRWAVPLIGFAIVIFIGLGIFWISKGGDSKNPSQNTTDIKIVDSSTVLLNDKDKAEIDDQLRRAIDFVEKAQYTDPPEKSAKACLDAIKQIDPKRQYRGDDIRVVTNKIVAHYMALADKSFLTKDIAGVTRWLERAKLMGAEVEVIREKERAFGILKAER